MYPGEPVITVVAPLIDAQLVETGDSAAGESSVVDRDKGTTHLCRRQEAVRSVISAQGARTIWMRRYMEREPAASVERSERATVLAGKMFDIAISGTMAHKAGLCVRTTNLRRLKSTQEYYPDGTVLLVDTYDVLESGIPNAIRVAKEVLEPMGKRLLGIRLDSGDLAYLSKKARKMLDDAGLPDTRRSWSQTVSMNLRSISLLEQGACIDSFGVGGRMIVRPSRNLYSERFTKWRQWKKMVNLYRVSKVSENI